jgi:hypothetical protein
MNCYVGLAKRLVNSCFPPVIPVPQLEPLDARNIIKQEVQLITTNKACFALRDANERISEEEAWDATLAWAEAKAQEREAAAIKAASQTDTDESYDSDDSEFGVSIQPVRKSALFAGSESDNSDWEDLFGPTTAARHPALQGKLGDIGLRFGAAPPSIAKNRYAAWVADVMIGVRTKAAAARAVEEKRAARTIQTAARGRAVRAWNPFVSAPTVSHIDTDESYDSDDSNVLFVGAPRVGAETTYVYSLDDAAAAAAMWRDDAQADADEFVAAAKAIKKFWANVDAANAAKLQAATIIQAAERRRVVRMVLVIVAEATKVLRLSKVVAVDWEGIAVARAVLAMGVAGLMNTRAVGLVKAVVECDAATIIQAAARGRSVRAWKSQFIDKLAIELVHIHRMRYIKRDSADWSGWFEALMLENVASPKCAMACIKLADRRRYGHHF